MADLEAELLRSHGHEVYEYRRSNDELTGVQALKAPLDALFSHQTFWETDALIQRFSPDLIHVHNWWVVVSPSVLWSALRNRIPVVQTLHNYRLLCPNAQFLREGHPCELCKNRIFASPGVRFGCYRQSRPQSLLVAGTVAVQRCLGTWKTRIAKYIALTEFSKNLFIEGGLPSEKIAVKPNFVDPDPGPRHDAGCYAVYVGRLAEEKGIRTLLGAWALVGDIPLKIVGDGPMMPEVRQVAATLNNVVIIGWQERSEVIRLMKGARFLVFPSVWYEGFGLTIAEAFACGTPVLASKLGAMSELVEDQKTGLHFRVGDPMDLAHKVSWAWNNPAELERMGRAARDEYLSKYTAEGNYQMLVDIYRSATQSSMCGG